ncbi:hypothetical protein BKA67DRAFT_188325 [Truncatella angustata]|uniref:RING-type domain-containing protein n=1 Tax=Truncatella angustata TaxID=152316 RepID=A0A9P9A0T2_9PEZI|nr:uncharacterized protein BKA67DRAFT_188325 [Truncatella angustata]KAH6657409.1 hypothetical protein BKA67DRAFT_188325 [Truncatella angustata]
MAGATPDSSKINGNAPTISTVLCITLAVVILIGVCVARKTNTLAALQEVAARTRSTWRGRGLEEETIDSIPIIKYKSTRPPNTEDRELNTDISSAKPPVPGGRLETILEDDTAALPATSTGRQKQNVRTRIKDIIERCSLAIPKRPTPLLQKPGSELVRQDASCPICTEDFSDGVDLRKLPCSHLYHPRCIDQWLRDFGVTCPLCRVDLSVSATVAALPRPAGTSTRVIRR